jgi:hypothetical protein
VASEQRKERKKGEKGKECFCPFVSVWHQKIAKTNVIHSKRANNGEGGEKKGEERRKVRGRKNDANPSQLCMATLEKERALFLSPATVLSSLFFFSFFSPSLSSPAYRLLIHTHISSTVLLLILFSIFIYSSYTHFIRLL